MFYGLLVPEGESACILKPGRRRRPREARGWAAALSGPHRRGRQRSKRHPGAASGRRAGHISVFVVVLRSQRRRGTRAAGPRVRGGGVPAPRKVAEHGARAPFQRALQTAKAVEVQLSSGAGRRRACKTTNVPGFYLMCFQSSMPVLSLCAHVSLCPVNGLLRLRRPARGGYMERGTLEFN